MLYPKITYKHPIAYKYPILYISSVQIRPEKKYLGSGHRAGRFDANKKKLQAANYNKTPSSPVNHRQSTEFLTITKTCSFSNFNLQDKILLCLAWFATIPGT